MAVPNIFGTATAAIPLSQLDQNFATAITLGNTAVYLGNTTASLGNVTLTNVTISSGNVTVTSPAVFPAGTVALPSITTTGDTNTGIFFPAADTIAFTEGGVEAMRIDSSANVGIGVTPAAGQSFVVGKNITGAVGSYAVHINGTIQSGVTSAAWGVRTNLSTVASAFTLANLRHHDATQGTFGAGSTVTNQNGFYVDNSLIGATNNYGFFGNIASGTNRWNLYMNGTAVNYMAGNLGIGTNAPSSKLEVVGNGLFTGNSVSTVPVTTSQEATFKATNNAGTFEVGLDNDAGDFGAGAYAAVIYNGANTPMAFFTNNTRKMTLSASGNLQMQAGAVMPYAPAPTGISAATTLTNVQIQGQIISTTGTTYTITMPLGSTLETLATWSDTNIAYDFYVVNTASGTITMAVNTGVTSLGGLTIATGVSAQFRIRRTAANTFVLYRLG